ncbi:MAG: OmpH family outer membrane protein [Bryobacteraceae bacterium]
MGRNLLAALAVVGMTGGLYAQSSNKVAVVNIQNAIVASKDGQKAGQELTAKFGPRQKEFDTLRSDLVASQEQLQKGGTTLAPDKAAQLQKDIDEKSRKLQRIQADVKDEYTADQQRLLVPLEQKMVAIITQYAKQKGFNVVLDTSGPVVFADPSIDITKDIVALYDAAPAGPAPAGTAPAAPAASKPPGAK